MLAAYAASWGESPDLAHMLDLLETPAPFSRSQFSPGHFTASGFVLPPERDALLLVWHPKIGAWLQPGGHIEVSDADPVAAAQREVVEETGVDELAPLHDGLFDVDVHSFPGRGGDPEHLHFDLRFIFLAASRRPGGGSETSRWVPLDELAGMDESLARPALKAQAIS